MAITRPYTAHEWETGDVITEERMNTIEKGIEAIDTEVFGARGYGTSSDNSLGSRIDDMIIISDSEPTSVNNEIWVKGENEQVEIPTYEEFEKLRESVAKAYDATITYKIGDYVLYDTELYCCSTAIDNAELWNAAHWAKVKITDEVDDLKNNLESVESFIDYNTKNLFNGIYTEHRRILTTNGEVEQTASTQMLEVSEYISVNPGETYVLNFEYYSSGNYGMAFYNSNKLYISGKKQTNPGSTVSSRNDFVFTVPEGSYFIRFTLSSLTRPISEVRLTIKREYDTLDKKIRTVINPLSQKVNITADVLDMVCDKISSNPKNLFTGEVYEKSRISTTTGSAEEFGDTYSTGYTSIVGGKQYYINFSYYSTGNYGIAFYDTDKIYITGFRQSNTNASSSTIFHFSAPTGAAYCRFTAWNSRSIDNIFIGEYNKFDFESDGNGLYYNVIDAFTYETLNTFGITDYAKLFGETPSILDSQGICGYGAYIYQAIRINGSDSDNTLLIRFNLDTKKIDLYKRNYSYGHANGMTYNPNDGYLYIIGIGTQASVIHRVSAETLDFVDDITIPENWAQRYAEVTGTTVSAHSIAYNTKLDKFLLGFGKGIGIFSNNWIHEKTFITNNERNTFGDLDSDANFIYRPAYNGVTVQNLIQVYDWNGKQVCTIPFTAYNEPEGIVHIDGTFYGGFNQASTAYIVKATPTTYSKRSIPCVLSQYNFTIYP